MKKVITLLLSLAMAFSLAACSSTSENQQTTTTSESPVLEEKSPDLTSMIKNLGYSENESDAIAEILMNVGIESADDMWNINENGSLQANACTYSGHQVNFTTDNGKCFYVQITGWDKELSHYGWYQSAWSGKLKYGYYTETKKNTVDLYATDSDNPGYMAIYDSESDSVRPYGE